MVTSENTISWRDHRRARTRAATNQDRLRRQCDKFGKSSVTGEMLDVPDLEEDALRYRTVSRLGGSGFAWALVSAV
ncbi:hypothetical protein [Streptomyces sp. NPDC006270]|uniref:hypothetical protein n=1 Tax=Streptomyces sp. NPDC006270 TaxID=3364741 RepID=UPI00368A8D60